MIKKIVDSLLLPFISMAIIVILFYFAVRPCPRCKEHEAFKVEISLRLDALVDGTYIELYGKADE